jgi:sigma-E factor negative regulatory protein RseC
MSEKIKHSGVVESVDGDCMKVRILQTSACAGCKAAGVCNAAEKKEKVIDIYGRKAMNGHKVGDTVVVTAANATGRKAVMIGFGLPLVILVVVLAIAYAVTHSEPLAALVSIAALVPYYIIIYMCRDRLKRDFSFAIDS